ncbi:MAG: hypothetical protein GX786_09695 [Clostridiales bacterium]|nr:hypothetical protein [Clostridiales bacterium]
MEENQKALTQLKGLLGLGMKSGQVVSGQETCLVYIRNKEAELVVIDESLSENSHKKVVNACKTHNVDLIRFPVGWTGQAIGKSNRTVAAVLTGPLAQSMKLAAKALSEERYLLENKQIKGYVGGLGE